MKSRAPRARASLFTLLLALPIGCSSGVAPAQQAATTPAATEPPSAATAEPSEHVRDTAHAHGPDTPPAGTAPASPPSAEPQTSSTPSTPSPEVAAYERAKPVFAKYCGSCHTTGGAASSKKALEHFVMDGYPFGGHHAHEAGATVRKSLGAGGSKATMPLGNPGAVKGDELASVLAWADAFDAAHSPVAKGQGTNKHPPHKH